jgi:membrane-associated phospholipid phosphatase
VLAALRDRVGPGRLLALTLTLQLAILAALGSALGVLVEDVISGQGAARLDGPVVRALTEHRTAGLTTSMRTLTWLGSSAVLIPLVVVVGLVAWRRTRSWATLAVLGVSLGGAILLSDFIKPVVGRPRPRVAPLVATATGYAFPSGHSTQVAAVTVTLAFLVSAATNSWPRKALACSIAVLVSTVVGFSRVYLGVHWPTDVVAGLGLGGAWAALSFAAMFPGRLPVSSRS